jgi:hypothetical protein
MKYPIGIQDFHTLLGIIQRELEHYFAEQLAGLDADFLLRSGEWPSGM